MTGFIYRTAIALKDLGERFRLSGIIRIALKLKDVALNGKIK